MPNSPPVLRGAAHAVLTRYLGPTSKLPPRIQAASYGGRTVVPYDHTKDEPWNHEEALRKHCVMCGASPEHWVRAGLPSGAGYAFIQLPVQTPANPTEG